MKPARLALFSIVLLHQGCSTSPPAAGPPTDGGTGNETGEEVGAGPGPTDAGVSDAVANDANVNADVGTACPPSYAGCSTFVTAPGEPTLVYRNYAYDPKCLSIKAGTKVTFVAEPDAGDFLEHPLVQACGPTRVLEFREAGTTASFVLSTPGVYGYYCLDHGNPQGAAMSGAIQVIP